MKCYDSECTFDHLKDMEDFAKTLNGKLTIKGSGIWVEATIDSCSSWLGKYIQPITRVVYNQKIKLNKNL